MAREEQSVIKKPQEKLFIKTPLQGYFFFFFLKTSVLSFYETVEVIANITDCSSRANQTRYKVDTSLSGACDRDKKLGTN